MQELGVSYLQVMPAMEKHIYAVSYSVITWATGLQKAGNCY